MDQIFPNKPVGITTPEIMRVYQLMRRLPDNEYYAWQRLSIWEDPGPDFWLIRQDRKAMLFKVSSATLGEVRAMLQPDLFGPEATQPPVGQLEGEILRNFQQELHHPDVKKIPRVVCFPNLTARDLKSIYDKLSPELAIYLSKEELTPGGFVSWLDNNLNQSISDEAIADLRRAFTPEVIIPDSFTVREPIKRHTKAELTGYLLDYKQEYLLKTDLDLSPDAQVTVKDFGVRLINGVAGSGKSLIIIYRAHLLRQLFPDMNILVLTHNRPLIRDLTARYLDLSNDDQSVKWHTFQNWCWSYGLGRGQRKKTVGGKKRAQYIRDVWHENLAKTAFTEAMLQEEIDWYKDRLLFSRKDYLAADRTGRGFALSESMRNKVYDAIEAYNRTLKRSRLIDRGDIPRQVWRNIQADKVEPPVYDVILVDEAQFFAPIWFEIIKMILKPDTGHLFLVADPSQGFLKRRLSWLASGLEVRGRAHRLDKSYRTTKQILDFATLLYQTRLPEDDECEHIVAPNLRDMPDGIVPVVIPLTSTQDETTRIVNEIEMLVESGVPFGHLLVIYTDWKGRNRLIGRLKQMFGEDAVVDPGQVPDSRKHIRVCTLNSATGIESPIVFIAGVNALYEAEQSVRLSEEERAELIRDNTRKLYMACTRAGQRLVLTYAGELPDIFQELAR